VQTSIVTSTRRALARSGLVPEPSSSRAIHHAHPRRLSASNSALLLPLLRRSAQPPSDLRLVAASTFPRASRDDRFERLARVLERLHATHEVYASHLAHAVDAHANIHAHPVDADDPQVVNLRLENFARGLVGRGAPLNRAGLGETRAVARVQFLRRERERERRSGESSVARRRRFKIQKRENRRAGSRVRDVDSTVDAPRACRGLSFRWRG